MNIDPQLPDGAPNILDVMKLLLWGCVLLGILGALVGATLLGRARASGVPDDAGNGATALIGGIITSITAGLASVFLPASDTDSTTAAAVPATDMAAPATVDESPNEPADWTPLIWIAGGAAAIAVLAVAGYLVVRTRHRILDRKTAAHTLGIDFAAARALYNQVAGAYAEYLADPYARFTRPLLDDLAEPRTAAFITAFTDAGALHTETCPTSPERVQALADASRAALTAWNTADRYARAIGTGVRTDAAARTVRRIRIRIRCALELAPSTTPQQPSEREAVIATVERLSDGLMTVPDRLYSHAAAAIETTTRTQQTR